jgi:hypothetical protein
MSHLPLSSLARRLAPVVLAVVLAAGSGSAMAATVPRAAPSGPCTTPDGVTVVVDLTDLGGAVEVGCAVAPATGTAALESAGFTDTRDAAQMICAINDAPKPCPATFAGSYWSYWHAAPGGGWQSYQVGSDQAVPAPGQVEGWRYNDGSVGPTVTPPVPTARPTTAASGSATATLSPAGRGATAPGTGPSEGTLAGLGLLAVLVVLGVLVARRRSFASGDGPPGQD